jgi:hypothetical protein
LVSAETASELEAHTGYRAAIRKWVSPPTPPADLMATTARLQYRRSRGQL